MDTERICPSCQKALAPDVPLGLCPECLIKSGFPTGAESGGAKQPPFIPPTVEELAKLFPQLEILELIGKGGMGAVYKARQPRLNRFVALKILPPSIGSDPAFAERFAREAQALAQLNHPGIVTLYEFGQAGGMHFFMMEFVDGVNLRQLLSNGRIAPREALAIVPQICDALQFAHDQGIVHRDIKPENILLDRRGHVKIADFGLAKIIGGANESVPSASGTGAPLLTEAGKIIGTPQYMSPEQIAHPADVDHRADIYALGVVFYQMLTGELPGKRIEPPSKKVQIDVRLDEVVLRALERKPELRYQQANILKTEVETIAATGSTGVAPHSASNGLSGAITSADLNRTRWKIVIWGFVLAVASISMPLFVFGFWGAFLFVVSATLALVAGDNLRMVRMAKRLVLIDGMVVASAAIWVAFNTSTLITPWLVAIVFGCLCGIGYCLSCWAKANKLTTESLRTVGWPDAKAAMLVGVAIILAAGTAALVSKHIRSRLFDKAAWTQDFLTLAKVPVATLRPSNGGQTSINGSDASLAAKGVSLRALMSYAYGTPTTHFNWSGNRVILPPGVPDREFDFFLTTPNQGKEALQAEIKKQLGLVAHRELRDVDVLVLMVPNPNAIGLAVSDGGSSSDNRVRGKFEFTNQPVGDLRDFLEDVLGEPVIDETELTQKYNGSLKWNPQSDKAAELKEIQSALANQFGLKLVPSHEPIEMLVVLMDWNFYQGQSSNGIVAAAQTLQSNVRDISSRTSPFRDTAKYLSPFTMVHFDTHDINKVIVAYNGSEYELAAIDDLSVADILDFCRRQYGQPPFGEGWAQKRFAEDLLVVLSDMKHPVSSDNNVRLTLVDPQTGQQKIIAHAPMTENNRAAVFQDRTLDNSNLLQSLPQNASFYIGHTWFPKGDSIVITSLKRTKEQMIVKGHYNLVSTDRARLCLFITTSSTNSTPIDPRQCRQISKGQGDFELTHPRVVPGLPHLNMWPVEGVGAFAELYFGTQAEAAEEGKLGLGYYQSSNGTVAAAQTLSFGPVLERVIQARQTGTNSFLDLDTGQLLTPPPDVISALTAVQPTDDRERLWQGLDILENTGPFRYIAWLRESGADLMFNGNGQVIAFDGNFIANVVIAHGESSTNRDDWAGLSPEITRAGIETISSVTQGTSRGSYSITRAPNSLGCTTASRLVSRNRSGLSVDLLTREQSVTWFFKTRKGSVGILQITGFTENPPGVKIRYQLCDFISRTGR